jgi:hypothetical protein
MFSRQKTALFTAALIVLVVAAIEGIARVAIIVLLPRMGIDGRSTREIYAEQSDRLRTMLRDVDSSREVVDSVLGWRYRPGYRRGGDAVTPQGLRGDRLYDSLPPAGVLRIAAFGDSFVYGNEVDNGDNWTSLLEGDGSEIEALNFGVGGYGVDQAYLRYLREGHRFSPHVVVMGFISDDLRRLVNVYRRFVDSREVALAKPRFVMNGDDGLRILPNPLPSLTHYAHLIEQPGDVRRLGENDQWYSPAIYENPAYDPSATVRLAVTLWVHLRRQLLDADRVYVGEIVNRDSEAYRLQIALFERFLAAAQARGAEPVILLFPDRLSLERMRRGDATVYAPIAEALEHEGSPVIDLADAFQQFPNEALDDWFMPGGHYSRRGNEIVAAYVREWLRSAESPRGPMTALLTIARGSHVRR